MNLLNATCILHIGLYLNVRLKCHLYKCKSQPYHIHVPA